MLLMKISAATTIVSMVLGILCAMFNLMTAGTIFVVIMIVSFCIMLLDFIFGDI